MPKHARPATIGCTLLGLIALLLAGCSPATPADRASGERSSGLATAPVSFGDSPTLTVHYIDVDQADATLLAGPDFTILIDAGRHDRRDVVPYLQSVGVETIDLLIGTHPHADHIGQFSQVLEAFPVTEVWMSGDPHTSRTFERAIDAILDSGAGYHEPRAGEAFQLGSAHVEVVNPLTLTGDLHEGSVSVRVVFGQIAFLFTGDAERPTELAMIERGHALQAHVLKLGHHGSRTSSIPEFLDAVRPEVAVYSAGEGNSYGHPHAEVVDRIAAMGIDVYGTPEHGTIRLVTDGSRYRVETQRRESALGAPRVAAGSPPASQININTATREELAGIAHIGGERADQLIRLRPFRSLAELTRIDGIGAARLQEIRAQGVAAVE